MPNITKIIAPFTSALRDTDCANNVDADAEVFATMAGRNRWFMEMLLGTGVETGGNPGVPKNPQGKVGIDNSGPPYGPALRHSYSHIAGIPEWICHASTLSGATPQVLTVTGRFIEITQTPTEIPFDFWVKPFSPIKKAPHSRCGVDFSLQNDNLSTVELYIALRNGIDRVDMFTEASPLAVGAGSGVKTDPTNMKKYKFNNIKVAAKSGLNTASIVVSTDATSGLYLVNAAFQMYGKLSSDEF